MFIQEWHKKIIATTNKSLTTKLENFSRNIHLIPQIPQDFIIKYIEEYNKGNKIEKVMVEYENKYFKRIIDMMETRSTKEILKVSKDNTISIKPIKDSFTRADIIHAFTSGYNKANSGLTHSDALIEYKKEQYL